MASHQLASSALHVCREAKVTTTTQTQTTNSSGVFGARKARDSRLSCLGRGVLLSPSGRADRYKQEVSFCERPQGGLHTATALHLLNTLQMGQHILHFVALVFLLYSSILYAITSCPSLMPCYLAFFFPYLYSYVLPSCRLIFPSSFLVYFTSFPS